MFNLNNIPTAENDTTLATFMALDVTLQMYKEFLSAPYINSLYPAHVSNTINFFHDIEYLALEPQLKEKTSTLLVNYFMQCAMTSFDKKDSYTLEFYKTKADTFVNPTPSTDARLQAMEETLKQNPQNQLRIDFANNTLYVQSNSNPTIETLYKIKVLQWTLINDSNPELDCEKILNFYKALMAEDLDVANTALNEIIEESQLLTKYYAQFESYFKSGNEHKLERLTGRIQSIEREIGAIENELRENYAKLRDCQEEYNMILNSLNETDTSIIINYLRKHPYIKQVYKYNSNWIAMQFNSPIRYFDTDIGKYTLKRYSGNQAKIAQVLLNPRYILWTTCTIAFDPQNFNVKKLVVTNSTGLIEHPHITTFGCFGNHDDAIKKWIENYDYIGAIEQISAATQNLNFSDSIVMKRLIGNLDDKYADIKTFFDTEKQKYVSIQDILKEEYENGETEINN